MHPPPALNSGVPPLELDLNLAALGPRRDSLAIMVQGNQLGWLRGVLQKTPDGFQYVEDTRIGTMVSQTTTLDMDARAEMRRVVQTGTVQGIATAINVTFESGRAKGNASTPAQDGSIRTIEIDTTFAPGTLDDNAIQALLPAFRWAPSASWTFGVLSTGQGVFRTMSLTVKATESVTVGGVAVECYVAELTGGPQPVTFWVSTSAPHRLLRLRMVGTPIEMVRVQ